MDGQHAGSAQVEDEQHLHGPTAYSLDAGEPLHDFDIGHPVALVEGRNLAVHGLLGDAKDIAVLGSGQPGAPELLGRGLQNRPRDRESIVAILSFSTTPFPDGT